MSLNEITRSLRESQSQLNFFDHAYRELSHESVLDYSFSALKQSREEKSDPSAAVFAAEVLEHCFPKLAPLQKEDEVVTWRQSTSRSQRDLRPDFVIRLSRGQTARWAALETKLGAPVQEAQLKDYRDLLRDEHGAEASESFSKVVLYKTTPFYDTPRSYDLDADDLGLLTMNEVGECLDSACEGLDDRIDPSWLIQEYRRWVNRQILRDHLLSHPDFQEWYLTSGKELPDTQAEAAEDLWPEYPSHRRRVHWHFVRRLARSLTSEESDLDPYVQSAPNARDDSAWVHVRLASLDDGTIFYRLDTVSSGQAALDLRLNGGPKRGENRDDSQHWIDLKKSLRATLRERLNTDGLSKIVDTPGRQEYTFQKAARETSLCRIWLPPHEKGHPPSDIVETFPDKHHAVTEMLKGEPEMRNHIESWTLPH